MCACLHVHILTCTKAMWSFGEWGEERTAQIKTCLPNIITYVFFFQIYYYHNVKCRREMFDKDIVMLQVMN